MFLGSPVATSLCEGEAVPKYVTLVKVQKKEFNTERVKLNTVRPFVMDSLCLSNCTLNRTGGVLNEEVSVIISF